MDARESATPITRAALKAIAKVNRHAASMAATEPAVMPAGTFDCIVCDPAWPYPERKSKPDTWQERFTWQERVTGKFKPMPLKAIAAMQIPSAENATLYLWTTQRFLPNAFYILERWEYRYRATLTWVKTDKRLRGKLGCGKWLRCNTGNSAC